MLQRFDIRTNYLDWFSDGVSSETWFCSHMLQSSSSVFIYEIKVLCMHTCQRCIHKWIVHAYEALFETNWMEQWLEPSSQCPCRGADNNISTWLG